MSQKENNEGDETPEQTLSEDFEESETDKEEEKIQMLVDQINEDNFKQFYEKGVNFKNEDNFSDAFQVFTALIKKGTSIYKSDLSIHLAMSYFQLGNSLLEKIEQTADLFQADENLKIKQIENHSESERVEPVQVAWENLEFARSIMEKHLADENDLGQHERNLWTSRLANCYIRTGECRVWQEDFKGGLEDYDKALSLLKIIKSDINPRRLAEVYFQIGNAHLYLMEENSLQIAFESFTIGKKELTDFIELKKQLGNNENLLIKELEAIIQTFDHKIEEVNIEVETKDETIAERKKIQECMDQTKVKTEFVKSEFGNGDKTIIQLGRFGKQKGPGLENKETLKVEDLKNTIDLEKKEHQENLQKMKRANEANHNEEKESKKCNNENDHFN